MVIQDLKPCRGSGTYRIGDSDSLVVMENITTVPSGEVCLQEHGIIVVCMAGRAQLEYDGAVIQLQKNDFFLYMVHSVVCKMMVSSDFNCRMIWFNLTGDQFQLCDTYFRVLCNRMKSSASALGPDIVRSLFGTLLLELASIMRCDTDAKIVNQPEEISSSLHKKRIIDNFMKLVEESDGRIRRVDEFASQLNITPKYLSTVLKEVLNRRPSTYIQLYTMKAIENRLRFTDMTMQEIANDLNFPNASFFGKYCKDHLGMTPLEYRIKYHNGR